MTVDPERLLFSLIEAGKAGIVVAVVSLGSYVGIGALLVATGSPPWSYRFLALTEDPVLNGLLTIIGCSTVVLCIGLLFLAQLRRENIVERTVVVLSAAIGLGSGSSLVRTSLPVVIEHL